MWNSRLEQFRTNQRGEQVDKQAHGNNASYVDHLFSSDVLAGNKKRIAKAHDTNSQDEHRRQPDCEIHLIHSSVRWVVSKSYAQKISLDCLVKRQQLRPQLSKMKDARYAFCIVELRTPDNTNPKNLDGFVRVNLCRI